MFKNLQLSRKFNLLLFAVFVVGVLVSSLVLADILGRYSESQITGKATVLLKTMISARNYTQKQINPELEARLDKDEQFLPQTVPGYAAREIFEDLRTNPEYRNSFYKEATLNPTNLRDKADSFEVELINRFRNEPGLKTLQGYRPIPSGELFYIAQPLAVTQESCLRCHSTPQAAPRSLITTYGSDNGFGWKLNEIVGAQIMTVPATEIITSARQAFLSVIGIVIFAFAATILLINWLLRRAIIQPIKSMAKIAHEVSTGNLAIEFEQKSNDEIGSLAVAFNRMKTSLILTMDILKEQRKKSP
jgi:HAMP domain-containing protein